MNQTINDEEAIKQYLLGRLPEEEQTPLEERLLTDDHFFEGLKVAEDELIDEYLAGRLTGQDRERFDNHFMAAPERQQKLRFSMALRKYIAVETAEKPDTGGGLTEEITSVRTAETSGAGPQNGDVSGRARLETASADSGINNRGGRRGAWCLPRILLSVRCGQGLGRAEKRLPKPPPCAGTHNGVELPELSGDQRRRASEPGAGEP
jgi:anti-sigma factor RsiW